MDAFKLIGEGISIIFIAFLANFLVSRKEMNKLKEKIDIIRESHLKPLDVCEEIHVSQKEKINKIVDDSEDLRSKTLSGINALSNNYHLLSTNIALMEQRNQTMQRDIQDIKDFIVKKK